MSLATTTKTGISMQPYLIALNHNQPETLLKTDNSTTELFVNSVMKPKHSNTWDMEWNLLIAKEVLGKLIVYYDRGTNNYIDCFTIYHFPIRHRQMRPCHIHTLRRVPAQDGLFALIIWYVSKYICGSYK